MRMAGLERACLPQLAPPRLDPGPVNLFHRIVALSRPIAQAYLFLLRFREMRDYSQASSHHHCHCCFYPSGLAGNKQCIHTRTCRELDWALRHIVVTAPWICERVSVAVREH